MVPHVTGKVASIFMPPNVAIMRYVALDGIRILCVCLFVCLFVLRQPCMSVPAAAYSPRGHAHEVRVSSPCIAHSLARARRSVHECSGGTQGVLRGYSGGALRLRVRAAVCMRYGRSISAAAPQLASAPTHGRFARLNLRPRPCSASTSSMPPVHSCACSSGPCPSTRPSRRCGALCAYWRRARPSHAPALPLQSLVRAHAVVPAAVATVAGCRRKPMSSARVAVQRQMPRHDARALRGRAHACRSRTTTRAAA
jgi:hypothetical protein